MALLRGINVGGKNKLPMRDLAAMFEAEGCEEVTTYIQSGNVIFSGDAARAARMKLAIPARIQASFGFASPVIVRSAAELAELSAFPGYPGDDPEKRHVAFLADAPSAERAASLDPSRSPPDTFALFGAHVLLHLPNGVAKTKLTNDYLDRRLGTVSTVRNYRTVQHLVELSGERA